MMLPNILRHAEKDGVQLSSVSRSLVLLLWLWDDKVIELWKCREEKSPLFCLSKLKGMTEYFNEYLSRPACLFFPC